MVLYEVTVDVVPHRAEAFERYMRQTHIPDIFATGCFRAVHFARASANAFRTWYQAERQEDLDRYLREHAPRLREDFVSHFPQGATARREVWTTLQSWP